MTYGKKASEPHPSISQSSCNSKIRSTIPIKSVSRITKSLHIHMSLHPLSGPQLGQLPGTIFFQLDKLNYNLKKQYRVCYNFSANTII